MAKSPRPTGEDLSQAIQAFNPQSVAIAAPRGGQLPTQDSFIQPQKLTNVQGPAPKVEIPNLQGPAGTFDARGATPIGNAPTLESQPAYQTAQALKEFAPQLNSLLDYLGKDWIQKNIRYGQAQYNQDPAYWGKLISQEPDPAVKSRLQSLNPWAAYTVEKSIAKAEAIQYPAWLRTKVASNPVIDDKGTRLFDVEPGSGAATEYIARQRSEFIQERGLNKLGGLAFSEEVTPALSGGEQQATETYYARAAEAKKQRVEESQKKSMVGIMGALATGDVKTAQDQFDAAFFSPNAGPWAGKTLPEQREILKGAVLSQISLIFDKARLGAEAGGLSQQEAKEQLRVLKQSVKEMAIGSPLAAEGRAKPFADDIELSAQLDEAITKASLGINAAVEEAAKTNYQEKIQTALASLGPNPSAEEIAAKLQETRGDVFAFAQATGNLGATLELETQRQRLAATLGEVPRNEDAYNRFQLLVAGVDAEGKPLPGGPMPVIEALRQVGGGDYTRGLDLVAGVGEGSMQMRAQVFGAVAQGEERRISGQEKAQAQVYETWRRQNQEAVQVAGQVYSTLQQQARLALELGNATPQQKNNILTNLQKQMPRISELVLGQYKPLLEALASPDPKVAQQAKATLDSAGFVLGLKEAVKAEVIKNVPGLGATLDSAPQGGGEGETFGGVTQKPIANPQKKLWGNYTTQNFAQDVNAILNGKEPSEQFKQRIRDRTGGNYSPSAALDTIATFLPELDGSTGSAGVAQNKAVLKRNLAQQYAKGVDTPLTRWAAGADKPQQKTKEEQSWLEMLGGQLNKLFNQNKPAQPQAFNPFIQPAFADQGAQIPLGIDRVAVMRESRRTGIAPQILAAAVAASGGYGGGGGKSSSAGFNKVVNLARQAGAKFPELVAAQWALESGYGKFPSGKNNLFGQKGKGTTRSTKEFINGQWVTVNDQFMDFASELDSVKFIVDKWYKGSNGANAGRTVDEAIAILQKGGYATDPGYRSKLQSIMRDNNATGTAAGPGGSPKSVANALAAAHKQAKREGKGVYRALEIVGGKDYASQVMSHAKVLGWGDQATITAFSSVNRMPFRAGSQGKVWVDPAIRRGRMSVASGYNHVQFGNSRAAGNDLNYKMTQARAADALIQHLFLQGKYDIEIPGPAEASFHTREQVQKFLRLPVRERLRKIVNWGDQHHGGPGKDPNFYWAIDINFKTPAGQRFYLPNYGNVISSSAPDGVVAFDSGVDVVHGSGLHGSW